jgi:hypothetical protein
MKFLIKIILTLGFALVLGVGSVWFLLANPDLIRMSSLSNGPWITSLTYGNKDAGMYEKAGVARAGLFALNKTETIYFSAMDDSNGEPLNSKNRYRIEGADAETRWWSITVYGEDHFLIPNQHNRWAYSVNNVKREADNGFIIHLSKDSVAGNWLPLGDDEQGISVTLRLYNPAPSVYENLGTIQLPRIIKEEK